MLLIACDVLNTFFQTFLFVWASNNVTRSDNKLSKFKFCALMLIIFVGINTFTYSGILSSYSNFAMVIFILLSIILFFRKSILDAFIGFGLSYSIIVILSYFLITFYQSVLIKLNLKITAEFQTFLFIFVPIWCSYIFVYKFRKHIFDATIALKGFKQSIVFVVIIDYALIFMDSLRIDWTTQSMGVPFKSILYFVTFLVFVFTVIYFGKVNDKSKEVDMLNIALSNKITELKKIKHDYGSEISSIYGLYQIGQTEKLGELLKGIVDRYQVFVSAVDVRIQASPIIESVLNYAVAAGIDVIALDDCDYNKPLAITNNDLLRILTNIVRNSVDALVNKVNPTIKFSSYNVYDGIIINIINNGPEVPKEIKDKIFEPSFSTKENEEGDRGYGLSIVKDIVIKCGGKVSVQSNSQRTQFRIEIPYKTD
ncbi:GHKL domain-containing protein [Clostridium sp. CS001]|uniref:sensor histidine kinase n=1 Tax=Clostridium sp. CS001 TaxID=2880648 RepID=UPI001CF2F3E5|nr:ATP-binding protein [Clostridium sp. CS001]MCB2288190.1 GHKL domain-containing protein [Clostridium sp. CS001]